MSVKVVHPKESKGVLEPMLNTFAVANGILYDYYAIKFGERKGPYVELLKLPPLISEGFVTFERKLYKVQLSDYIRRRVNVTNPYRAPAAVPSPNVDVVETIHDTNKPAVVQIANASLDQAVDLAWQEQIDALHYLDDPEEEWLHPFTP